MTSEGNELKNESSNCSVEVQLGMLAGISSAKCGHETIILEKMNTCRKENENNW